MPVTVQVAQDEDMPRIFEICALAFGRNEPFWDLLYPEHDTEQGRQVGAERMRLSKNSDRFATYLKACDETTGSILGMAKWNVYNNDLPGPDDKPQGMDGDYWPTKEDKEDLDKLIPKFLADRKEAMERSKGNLVSLDILAIDPAHQRKKVGDTLVKWGTSKADQMGVETVVESSRFGKGLYEKNGFVFQKDVVFNVPGSGRPDCRQAWLVRPIQTK